MKKETIEKYTKIINSAKSENKSIKKYCEENGINYNNVYSFISRENKSEIEIIRDCNNKIIEYKVTVYRRDKIPFLTTLDRKDAEILWGLYTYYGGNVTARNVANEFPKYTLPEVKYLFRAFGITKDSIWSPPHLTEELTVEELSQYRMNLKERAAFKYADSQQERDFKNTLNKIIRENSELKQLIQERRDIINYFNNVHFPRSEFKAINNKYNSSNIVIFLSDIHVGAFNEKYGYIQLEDYDEEEITRRLNKIIEFLEGKYYDSITVCNLGDSVDSYNKQTTRGGHDLPTVISNKEQSELYLKIMMKFFNSLAILSSNINYVCVGESNHDGDWGWINNIVLANKLKESFDIESTISNNPIDSFDINDVSIIFLHGKDNKSQFKGFPLTLDFKTESWFNSYFIDSGKSFKKRKCIVKGDLHQYAHTCAKHFDYISAPSLYGSSNWIVANFGKTPWGCLVMEIDNDNIKNSIIKD